MKKHIQIKNSYKTWDPAKMALAIRVRALRCGHGEVIIRDAHIIEWWLHNIGYYITLPFVANSKIKALNERFKHVDLMLEARK